MTYKSLAVVLAVTFLTSVVPDGIAPRAEAPIQAAVAVTHYRTTMVDGVSIFYREAGPADAPVVLLLHGFPTSSHMFRNLIPILADRYHVIAPTIRDLARATRRIIRSLPTRSLITPMSWTTCFRSSA
jgi:hypothetical protein